MKIFVLNGPTLSGKTYLLEYLLLNDSDYMELLVSFTTRPRRQHEKDGADYHFIDINTYLDYRVKQNIAEEIEYFDHHYGFTWTEIDKLTYEGKNGVCIANLEGVRKLKSAVGPRSIVSIFIYRDLTNIIEAIEEMEIPQEQKTKRMQEAKVDLINMGASDYVIYNTGTLADAYEQLTRIIKQEINAPEFNLEILPGQKYRHFKGDVYEIITTALHTESYSPLVVYKNLNTEEVFARPYEIFAGKKQLTKEHKIVSRFELVKED